MRILGKTTVRGPYSEYEKKRIASLIDSHSFNTQVSCFLPFLDSIPNNTNTQQEKKKIEFDDDESDEDNFLSFKNTKSTLFNDSELMKQTGWYYRIKGPVVSLFNEQFYTQYISSANGLTLSTIHTPTNLTNSLCIIQGKFLVLHVDKQTFQTLGISGKHASARLLSDRIYICSIDLTKLKWSSNLIQRVIECFSHIPPMEMICFCGNEEITFPEGIQYEKIQNQSEQSFVTNIKIPQLQSSILSDVLKSFQIDKSQYPEEEYNEIKGSFYEHREQLLRGFLDWIGLVDLKSEHILFEMNSELSDFTQTSCFPCFYPHEHSSVKVYKTTGFIPAIAIKERLASLIKLVNDGVCPFAVIGVYGDKNCCVQWIVNERISEYDYILNDDSHYIILILPNSTCYTMILSSDLESRLYCVC